MFLEGCIYRRIETDGYASVHDYPDIIFSDSTTTRVKFGDEFYVLEARKILDHEIVHVLGCNREFMGWTLTCRECYKKISEKD